MSFLDEDDAFEPAEARVRSRPTGSGGGAREFLLRRAIAGAAGVLILALILLGFKACQDSRRERALTNYVSDLRTIVVDSKQLSDDFFGRIGGGGESDQVSFNTAINSNRSTADSLLSRVEALDVPGQLDEAQKLLVLAYQFRRDGVSTTADQITSVADPAKTETAKAVVDAMRGFLAADEIFQRAANQINQELLDEGISQVSLPESAFLEMDGATDWLNESDVTLALSGLTTGGGTGSGPVTPGVHGTEVSGVTGGGIPLDQTTPITVPSGIAPEIVITVRNGGESTETDIPVTASLEGTDIEGQSSIASIDAGAMATVSIQLTGDIPIGEQTNLTVNVELVPGETIGDNNTYTYPVIFQ